MDNYQPIPFILFQLCRTTYALSCRAIRSIDILASTVPVPNSPEYVRGIMNLRGKTIEVVDLRKLLGMQSLEEEIRELEGLMEQRKQDHIRWLEALETSIREKTRFNLATDPHLCAFGKWYDSYQTTDNSLRLFLKRFDKPHQRIHGIALEAISLEEKGFHAEAVNLIEETRNRELRQMIALFSSLTGIYRESKREIVMTLDNGAELLGVIVDEIMGVEHLAETDVFFDHDSMKGAQILDSIRKRKKDDSLVIILNETNLLTKDDLNR